MSHNRPILALVADLESARRLARHLRQDGVDATILVGDDSAGLRAVHRLDPAVLIAQVSLLRADLLRALRAGTLPPLVVLADAESPAELISLVDAGAFAAVELPAEAGLLGRVLRRGRALHQLVGETAGRGSPGAVHGHDGDELDAAAADDDASLPGLAWQPVVSADDLRVFGYELLDRVAAPGGRRLGQSPALSRVAAELERSSPRGAVFVTLPDDPGGMADMGTARDPLAAHALRVVLQVRAAAEVTDPRALSALGRRLHGAGYRIALTGLESGVDHLAHLLALRPELVKLAPSTWQGTDRDALRWRLVRSLADMARSLGARVVAEGVDAPDQADLAAELGCALLQGRLLGEAAPARVWLGASQTHDRRRPRKK